MNTPQFEISISKLEKAIVHFIVAEEIEMVAELCELWLACKGTYCKDELPMRVKTPDVPSSDLPEITLNTNIPETAASKVVKSPITKQTFSGVN